MTRQYLAGELSIRLGQLEAAAPDPGLADHVASLRRQGESVPLDCLPDVASRALALIDQLCLESLRQGDSAAFTHHVALGSELYDFANCSGLFEEED
jgi:hypothetical protein